MKEYRDVKLFTRVERPSDIFRRLESYREMGSAKDHVRSGRPRSARTPAAIKMKRERVHRKINRSIRKTAADLDVSIGTGHTITSKDLGYMPYKKRKDPGVMEAILRKRLDRAKLILSRHPG